MGQISRFLAAGAAAWILYICICKFPHQRSYNSEKRRHNCGEAVKYPHKDPILVLDLLIKMTKEHGRGVYLEQIKREFSTYGKTHESKFIGTRMIRTIDPKNIQTVPGLNAKDYGLETLREGLAMPLFGRGINTTDGEYWQYSRFLIKPTFSRTEICNLDSLEFHFGRLMELLPKDGATVDLQPLFSRLFLDTSTEFLFGKSADTLLPVPSEEGELFINSFDYVTEGLGYRVRLGRLKFLHRDPLWFKLISNVHAYVEKHIDKAIDASEKSEMSNASEEVRGPSRRYVLLNEMVKQIKDKLELRSQILAVFMPSRDTSGTLVSNIFHVLARNPAIWTKLRKEVLSVGKQPLTFELLKSMKYLQWIINETHRMYPVSENNPRCVLADSVLLQVADGMENPHFLSVKENIYPSTSTVYTKKKMFGVLMPQNFVQRDGRD